MNPINKGKLIDDIYFSMQTTHTESSLKQILKRYGIAIEITKSYTVAELKQVMNDSDDEKIITIAKDLELSTEIFMNTSDPEHRELSQEITEIFISHAIEDIEIVSDFIQVLQGVGVTAEQIFCSSLEGFGTPLGKNFEEEIKTRLNDNVLVLFMISEHFYNSNMCMLEMGAVWGLTKDQISIAIPPYELSKMKGVFLKYQGIRIDKEKQLDLLKEMLENKLNIKPQRHLVWERTRDMALSSIRTKLPEDSV